MRKKKRKAFKFKLLIIDQSLDEKSNNVQTLSHNRIIPSHVKLEVWKRDGGKCTTCQSTDNLHYDHILPYSKGGSSLVASNIQLLCTRHNLAKSDIVEWRFLFNRSIVAVCINSQRSLSGFLKYMRVLKFYIVYIK